jgi:hypothetical protein
MKILVAVIQLVSEDIRTDRETDMANLQDAAFEAYHRESRNEISAHLQVCSRAHPASFTLGNVYIPGVTRPGLSVDHPTPSSVDVKERVELHLYSVSGLS